MKDHTSHDVLLLCPRCHQHSNGSDLHLRHKLATLCDAPFTYEKAGARLIELPNLKYLLILLSTNFIWPKFIYAELSEFLLAEIYVGSNEIFLYVRIYTLRHEHLAERKSSPMGIWRDANGEGPG